MKLNITTKGGLLALAVLLMLAAPGVAYARNGAEANGRDIAQADTTEVEDGGGDAVPRSRVTGQERAQAARELAEARVTNAKARLEGAQLKRCEAREQAIRNMMDRIADRGEKQTDVFKTIADRVIAFHEEKGKEFDASTLIAEVEAAEQAARTEVGNIKAAAEVEFNCAGEDPRSMADGFKISLKLEIDALKNYKTAVRNLIVGVKTANGATTDDSQEQEGAAEQEEQAASADEGVRE